MAETDRHAIGGTTPVTPLRKKNRKGKPYHRDDKVEETLRELLDRPEAEVLRRCAVADWRDAAFVPSECLVYLFRMGRGRKPGRFFEAIFKLLQERVLRRFVKADSALDTLTSSNIREKVCYEFVQLLARDHAAYEEKLDYYEVRFDGAVACLRKDAQDRYWKEEGRRVPLEVDEESGEFTKEVQDMVGDFDPFSAENIESIDYRSRLEEAIESLPPEQQRILEMIRQKIPIESKDSNAITMVKVLGKSEKMIRIYRDRAFARLRAILAPGGRR